MHALTGALWGIVAAIGASALLFVGVNRLFDLIVDRWRLFLSLIGALIGAGFFAVLVGNRVLDGSGTTWVIGGAVLFALLAVAPDLVPDPRLRPVVGAVMGTGIGVLVVVAVDAAVRPTVSPRDLIVMVGITVGVYVVISAARGRIRPGGVLVSAALGWVAGSWLLGEVGGGSPTSMALAVLVPFGLLGAALGAGKRRERTRRYDLQRQTRVGAFLGPAMFFVSMGLVVPLIRTIYLSLHDSRGRVWVGLKNYGDVLTNKRSLDLEDWANIFGSRLTYLGAALLVIGLVAGLWLGRRRGRLLEPAASSIGPASVGVFLLMFAMFASLRGTVMNNLWWVIVVTLLSTVLGLAAAVLAERARFESLAKSLIFMPMAISFVGAGIIWRFMYIARPPQKPQTGLFNAIWVGLGTLEPSSTGHLTVIVVLGGVTAAMLGLSIFGTRRRQPGIAIGSAFVALPLLWLLYRFLGPGLGGVETGPLGNPIGKPILFVQEGPFNNVWMMLVLIWIQTGFAMVILSAAIKAVPGELLEAARVDGATDGQVFFHVTLPTIVPTIGVIVTALIVLVMKVFDIVRVMTNGNFGTQVIANEMWQRAFTEFNLGLGSALAVVLFLSVVPVMGMNIRRMQRNEV